jgi:hypothetical protein
VQGRKFNRLAKLETKQKQAAHQALINPQIERSTLPEKPTVDRLVKKLFPAMSHEDVDIGTHFERDERSKADVQAYHVSRPHTVCRNAAPLLTTVQTHTKQFSPRMKVVKYQNPKQMLVFEVHCEKNEHFQNQKCHGWGRTTLN